jgi:hypothetical protein
MRPDIKLRKRKTNPAQPGAQPDASTSGKKTDRRFLFPHIAGAGMQYNGKVIFAGSFGAG